jgi:phospholipid/cholesterol/gamma-HCH transport system substrate-binding protein
MADSPKTRSTMNRALAVGLLVAVAGGIFLVAFTFFRKGGLSARDSYVVTAVFDDVTGLSWKSRVQVAGIQIGEVTEIELTGDKARITMRVKNGIPLRANACLTKRFPSALLPDALLEASLGTSPAPLLEGLPSEGREITCVREAANVAKLMESLSKIATDIQVVSADLAKTVGGTQGSVREIIENLTHVTRAVDDLLDQNSGRVAGILKNTEAFTGELREITQQDAGRYHSIAKNIDEASARLNRVLASVEDIVGTGQPELKESVHGARQALQKLNKTLDDVQSVTSKVAAGQGVAGKLLVDEQLGEKVGAAAENVSDYVNRISAWQLYVNIRSEYLVNYGGTRAYFGVTLMPKPDKYYILELMSDPRGYNTLVTETATTTNQTTGTSVTTTTVRSINEQRLALTAMFGKRWGDLVGRIGLIESSGGVGVDYLLFQDRLKLSANIYGWTRPTVDAFPRTKLWLDWRFIPNVYLTGGVENLLNTYNGGLGREFFIGAGVYFGDQDMRALMVGGGGAAAAGAAAGGMK